MTSALIAWPLQAKHPGQTHFDMEAPGQPSRWNTPRALRVLERFEGWGIRHGLERANR